MDQDIDKRNDEETSSSTLQSQQGPSKPIITNCELEKGVIKLSWTSVFGAKTHRLVIKDEFLQKNLVKDEVISGSENTVKIQTTENLCIGRTCMIKIITSVNNLNAESEWRAYLIGGSFVPRNVQAIQNPDNPKRSILVTFDTPKQGPAKEYKITTLPKFGKSKTFYCSSNTMVVEYLRKGLKYKFHVFAKHGEEWSDGSISNPQETDQDDNYNPTVGFYGNTGSQFDLVGAHFTGYSSIVNFDKAENFGKVRDLVLVPVREKQPNKNEILKLSWKVPSFDNNAFDYKVEKYKVKIWNINSPDPHAFYLEFVKDSNEYYTDNQELELGETYNISVSTIYIDIDQDEEYVSNAAEEKVQTRPCQPTGVKYNIETNDSGKVYLKIEWNAAKGATYYTVDIHTDEFEQLEPLFMHKVEKGTEWERIFDDRFGYGTSYHAVITAIGNENKSNSKRTDQQTIGGDFTPNKVIATIDHDKVVDPNTEVYLSWEPPTKQPESYEVTFENEGKHIIISSCVSNSIQTNPTPTLVKNVQTFPGDDWSTSINISWDNEEESTKYRVNVISSNEKMSKYMNTTDNWIAVDGLLPDTNYFIRVAGGNSNGFGKDSIVTNFETGLGIPKNIYLLNNTTSPDTSLILQFSEAKGKPVNYLGALNKCENQGQHESLVFIDVQPGYTFNELEPNTKYYVMVLCVFENGKKGKAVKSEALITAPSKPVIDKSGCCTDNKINSSKVFFLKWKSDRGCREHEIIIKHGDKVESQQIIKNRTELKYSCMYKASRYTAQIRTKNITFGQWSDEAVIDLAPVKLKNIKAELDQESNNILIQCKKEAKHSLSYFCQPLCSDKSSGEPVLVPTQDDENIVKFTFIPTLYAEKYSFKMWAVDGKGLVGESSLSPYVISRPAKGQITKVERNVKYPSTDIDIIWETLERCDEYEIQIKTRSDQKFETCARSTDTSFNYRCKIPGRTYVVSIRGIRESVRGNLSDKVTIGLVPGQVELIEDRDAQEPVETVQVKWKELETKPEGYRVILYNERKEEIATETESEFTHHVFKKLAKPGSLCYCTVAAYNTTGKGKPAKAQNYRIIPEPPTSIICEANSHINGIMVTFKDNSNMKNSYEICAESLTDPMSRIVFPTDHVKAELPNLIPGEFYKVSLVTICKTVRSKKVFYRSYIQTYPDKIKHLHYEFQDGCLIYKWSQPAIAPDEYIVQWRVNNELMMENTTMQTKFKLDSIRKGQKYEVRIAASNTAGKSKMEILQTTIPATPGHVELIIERDAKEPVESVQVQWKELKTKPEGYRVSLYNERNEQIATDTETEFTHTAYNTAYNTAGEGKPTKSQNYRINWNTPKLVIITPDETNPSKRANISWKRPYGVTCFRLEIENNQSGTVITLHLEDTSYIFESGIPGNSYTIRLYSGCDGRYDVSSVGAAMEMNQLSAMEQLFRKSGKSDEYTTELGVKGSRREVGILSTLDKSLHSSESEGEPVRKSSSDVLPSDETPTCQSKSVIIRYEKDDSTRDVEINEIVNIIKSNSEVDMIEFCDYKIGNDYCAPEENQINTAKCKISKLIISYTDHFKEFSSFFYSTFGGCEIKSLSFEYANLDDQDVEELQRFMTTKQVKGIESLDLSYNNKICPDGFEKIGNMIAEHGIKTLIAIDCDLEKMKLAKLLEGLKNVNLRELDIGYNDNLTENGFEMLAELVASRGIEVLKLRGCQLTEETIKVFYNKLEKTEEKVLLNELDVSYNPEMNPACCEVLGLIIKKFGITTLNLAGCRISEKHLTSLMSTKDIEDIKLHTINLRDNSYPGNIMVEIVKIVSKFDIQELDISDCKFSVSKLKMFRTNYSGTQLQKLHLGDEGCELGINYIQEVCELLTTVNDILYLRCHRLDNSCHRLLNERSGQIPKIQLCNESDATSD